MRNPSIIYIDVDFLFSDVSEMLVINPKIYELIRILALSSEQPLPEIRAVYQPKNIHISSEKLLIVIAQYYRTTLDTIVDQMKQDDILKDFVCTSCAWSFQLPLDNPDGTAIFFSENPILNFHARQAFLETLTNNFGAPDENKAALVFEAIKAHSQEKEVIIVADYDDTIVLDSRDINAETGPIINPHMENFFTQLLALESTNNIRYRILSARANDAYVLEKSGQYYTIAEGMRVLNESLLKRAGAAIDIPAEHIYCLRFITRTVFFHAEQKIVLKFVDTFIPPEKRRAMTHSDEPMHASDFTRAYNELTQAHPPKGTPFFYLTTLEGEREEKGSKLTKAWHFKCILPTLPDDTLIIFVDDNQSHINEVAALGDPRIQTLQISRIQQWTFRDLPVEALEPVIPVVVAPEPTSAYSQQSDFCQPRQPSAPGFFLLPTTPPSGNVAVVPPVLGPFDV